MDLLLDVPFNDMAAARNRLLLEPLLFLNHFDLFVTIVPTTVSSVAALVTSPPTFSIDNGAGAGAVRGDVVTACVSSNTAAAVAVAGVSTTTLTGWVSSTLSFVLLDEEGGGGEDDDDEDDNLSSLTIVSDDVDVPLFISTLFISALMGVATFSSVCCGCVAFEIEFVVVESEDVDDVLDSAGDGDDDGDGDGEADDDDDEMMGVGWVAAELESGKDGAISALNTDSVALWSIFSNIYLCCLAHSLVCCCYCCCLQSLLLLIQLFGNGIH